MSQEIFLSINEVKRLTGTPHKKKQIEYLKQRGIPFVCDVNGRPVPHKYYINQMYGVKVKHSLEPDFDALDN